MNTRKFRHRRNVFSLFSIIFLFVLCIYFLFTYLSKTSQIIIERPEFCDETIIRQHFMNNKSPKELFEDAPIQQAFTYEISNGNFCYVIKPQGLIFVVSKSNNYDARNAIRRTWGNFYSINSIDNYAHLKIKLLFLIDIDETYLIRIRLEQNLHNDIVQVHLPEQYFLSTYRDMAILHWTNQFCSDALLTIKTDDDIFLNTYLLANIIQTLQTNLTINSETNRCSASDPSGIIYGVRINRAKVVRDSNDGILEGKRYIVTDNEYPCVYYPPYMSGFGYLIDSFARQKLLCTFFRDPKPFHMSDAYVTGVLPEYLDIRRKHLGLTISYSSTDDCEDFFRSRDSYHYACASGMHYKRDQINIFERFHIYWQRIQENKYLYIQRNFLYLFKSIR